MEKLNKRYVFGLGTGRSGTSSLSALLSLQKDCLVTHESLPLVSWNKNDELLKYKISQISKRENAIVGDVCMSYLPYVEDILNLLNKQVKFICLYRDPDEVINSYLHKTKGRNHWVYHDGTEWDIDFKWDPCYPKYPSNNKEEALRRYVNDYKLIIEKLKKKYPDIVYTSEMNYALNNEEGQKKLLEFINFWNNPIVRLELRRNKQKKNKPVSSKSLLKKCYNYLRLNNNVNRNNLW